MKSSNQKLKILYLQKILLDLTDETHSISMAEIIAELAKHDISAERKSLYNDIECLRQYGMDIIGEKRDGSYYYHIGNRQFELAELKLLVDSVQSAKFITEKKSEELIHKIEGFASKYEAKQLDRQVYVAGRVKTMNERIYYNVDAIHSAIAANSQIRFQYFQYDVEGNMALRRNGDYYQVSPWTLVWNDENYYLIAYAADSESIRHYRVDKMLNTEIVPICRRGWDAFHRIDTAKYTRQTFGMYGGREELVRLRCENSLAGPIIDRFGNDITLRRDGEEHFTVSVTVDVSNQFLHWVMALGSGAEIIGPEWVVEETRKEVQRLFGQYKVNEAEDK
ncbi:MAG: WYL domain-containing protein [Lachnospiraceae bacterium]|nr:WYL domain-containing protein [Lachnospiraceae bacterium]